MSMNIVNLTDEFNCLSPQVKEILISDMTTNKNILGIDFKEVDEPTYLIPRALKSKHEKEERTSKKAEVFTPLNIIDKMVDVIDNDMSKIQTDFDNYIDTTILEITCGEAPFITTRYDPITGNMIGLYNRVGCLDRKLQFLNKHNFSEENWYAIAIRIAKSIYGYEYQADSLLIARLNVLYDFIEFYNDVFHRALPEYMIYQLSEIIVWNLFQMDGLTYCIPQHDVVQDRKTKNRIAINGIPTKIMNWKECKVELFSDGIK